MALLHAYKRKKNQPKPKVQVMNLEKLNQLLPEAIKTQEAACVCILTITGLRIGNLLNLEFEVEPVPQDDETFILKLGKTKTTAHAIFICPKTKRLIDSFKLKQENRKTATSYAKVNSFTKERFQDSTHMCRRASATILKEVFSEDQIRVYGNWSSGKDTMSSRYLRDGTLKQICDFWKKNLA